MNNHIYRITDVASMTKEEWRQAQPFYKNLARHGYFTNGLPFTNFYESFYRAINHPVLDINTDMHYHLSSYPLYLKEITTSLYFLPQEDKQKLYILMIYVDYKGLWAVLWQIILHLCHKYGIKEISLKDRSFFDDVWTHYGFDGNYHDEVRKLCLI